jgi:phosphomannomutase
MPLWPSQTMTIININELMQSSGVQFGTSGVRGLVKDMTDQVCFIYVCAFLQNLSKQQLIQKGCNIGLAGDLRYSTPRIMNAASAACITMGYEPINYGTIPSPAIALYGIEHQMPTIMVTGSHIPDDRNGIKFNTAQGEILKQDEQGIRAQHVTIEQTLFTNGDDLIRQDYLPDAINDAEGHYIKRFTDFLPTNCLNNKSIGLYEHSSVSRDCFKIILEQLGASVTSLGRSEQFISVDTEAIRPEDVTLAKQWSQQYEFDCIISTDGDGDRPLISDEKGNWLRGDVAGMLCAQYLNLDSVITPVSSNSIVEKSNYFKNVVRTKIGSPYVIEAMQKEALSVKKTVAGYEANGGFLQQTAIFMNDSVLSPLPTRDAVIVPIAIILLAEQKKLTISQLLTTLPQRYTFSDRIKNFPIAISANIINRMVSSNKEVNLGSIKSYFDGIGEPVAIDVTDGVRITFSTEGVVHIRPSGNAPELRCYTESDTAEKAEQLNQHCIKIMKNWT